ncbi:AI-2E family transporter, partial [Klebsiella aerogenes]|uniref:AI-2E family transporter n=2 Tax=Klebsiella/Raoultella group TaxID=2890311 RepID=UPI00069E463F
MIENNELANIEKRIVTRFLDMFIKFGLILALASFCFTVFSPFLNMMLWALILAVTLYPLHQHIARRIGGRQGLASTILVLFGLLIIVIPTIFMVTSLGESAGSLIDKVSGSDLTLPPPSANVASIPLVGGKLYAFWLKASADLPAVLSSYHTQIGEAAKLVLGVLASMGGGLLGFVLSFIVAGAIMTWGAAGANSAKRIAIRITDETKGVALSRLCTGTIRAVAQGVIGVALIQALLTGIIIALAGIPAA